MADFLQGAESGGEAAAATGNPWLIAAGALLGGLFGPRERYTPAQEQQMRIANQIEQFGNSVPLSDPQEQSALAEQRGMLGEAQRQDMGTLMSMTPNFASTGAGGAADQVARMKGAQTGQSMALSSQALMNALMARRRALMEAAQVAQGVGKPTVTPGLGGDLANLMRAYSQFRAQQGQQGQQTSGYGTGGDNSQVGTPGGYGTNVPLGGGYSTNLPPEFGGGGVTAQSVGAGNNLGAPGPNPFQPPSMPQQGPGPGGNPFQQDFQTLMSYGPKRPQYGAQPQQSQNNPWQAGMNNFTNGMGQWPMDQAPAGAGWGIPSSNATPDAFMGGGNPASLQALMGMFQR